MAPLRDVSNGSKVRQRPTPLQLARHFDGILVFLTNQRAIVLLTSVV